MPRKHLFPLVVLLGAAVVAGLLALTRTVDLGQPAGASTTSDPAIGYRLQRLDDLERSLREQLADPGSAAPATRTVVRRAPSPTGTAASGDGRAEHEDDDEHHDEGHEDERDD